MKKMIIFFLFVLIFGCITPNDLTEENTTIQVNLTNESNGIENNGSQELVLIESVIINESSFNQSEEDIVENLTLEGLEFGESYVLVLDDLSLDKPEPCAILSIYELESKENIQQVKICPGEEYYWTNPEGQQYRIKVIETAAGYSYGAGWANIIIYG